jgi:hypothetical protein
MEILHLEDLSRDRRITLRGILQKKFVRMGGGWNCLMNVHIGRLCYYGW